MPQNIMGTYKAKATGYEVFGANMTVDTQTDVNSAQTVALCQKCQCNCRLCRGGRAPEDESMSGTEVENALGKLLEAA